MTGKWRQTESNHTHASFGEPLGAAINLIRGLPMSEQVD
jgi:hypothetical protein